MTRQEAFDLVRGTLVKRYPDYFSKPKGERVLLAASVLVNDFKVSEQGGNNRGPWVKLFLNGVKLNEGYAWCAAFIEFCCDIANVDEGPDDRPAAAVISWVNWAKPKKRIKTKPTRGDLTYWLNKDGTGHIAIVAGVTTSGSVITYEGNTGPGETGSQRDGDGAYKRTRKPSVWHGYIDLD